MTIDHTTLSVLREIEALNKQVAQECFEEKHLQLALEYRNFGFYVVPCWNWDKPCLINWKKRSTRDMQDIRKLWSRFIGAIPAIDLAKSQTFAIECELYLDGVRCFIALCESLDVDTRRLSSLIVQAPCGDRLYFWRIPDGRAVPKSGRLAPGVNVISEGFVPVAGATRADGLAWKPIHLEQLYTMERVPLKLYDYILQQTESCAS